jgi:hypothetical protein
MASLALAASIVFLFILFIGPVTYLFARLGLPAIIIYPLGLFSIISGIWFAMTLPHIFYIGLIPIYLGYISVVRASKKN